MLASSSRDLIDALHADRPAPDRADKMDLYGWLVGSWEMDVLAHGEDGATRRSRGEVHFGWVLEGRAIQDVWITPPRRERRPDMPQDPLAGNFYGTTLRIYDPGLDAWHILWIDPVKGYYSRQIGRAEGADIVQEGTDSRGFTTRWSFTEINPDSFHWLGERLLDDGTTWRLETEFLARRLGTRSG